MSVIAAADAHRFTAPFGRSTHVPVDLLLPYGHERIRHREPVRLAGAKRWGGNFQIDDVTWS